MMPDLIHNISAACWDWQRCGGHKDDKRDCEEAFPKIEYERLLLGLLLVPLFGGVTSLFFLVLLFVRSSVRHSIIHQQIFLH